LRIRKEAAGAVGYFHYDLSGLLLAETDGAGNPVREYIYYNSSPIAVREYASSPGFYYFLNNHLGAPKRLIDSGGATVWRADYLQYGKALVAVEAVPCNIRLPGQYHDAETGLHYNWHRYYDPNTGRYISADPIGIAGGLNLYGYVDGDPVNATDPEGLTAWDVVDFAFWGWSTKNFINKPSWSTGGELLLDTVSLLPIIPSVGWVTKADDVLGAGKIAAKSGTKFWSKAEFNGQKVYQRNDLFDPNTISSWKVKGKTVTGTNIERMASGRAPIGYDGKSLNLRNRLAKYTIAERIQTGPDGGASIRR
jgi:RHS repeat-associated protein